MDRMLARLLGIAAVLIILAPAVAPVPAHAIRVNVNIGIGTSLDSGRRISCAEGARLIRNRGFFNVTQRNCRGRNFTYRAARRGRRYEISIRASDGRVVHYRRLGRI
jgi:hypothetical protein